MFELKQSLQSISILRQLRDDDTFITKSTDRMQVFVNIPNLSFNSNTLIFDFQLTLFIIELYNCEKDVTLLGVMQLSKRIILKVRNNIKTPVFSFLQNSQMHFIRLFFSCLCRR